MNGMRRGSPSLIKEALVILQGRNVAAIGVLIVTGCTRHTVDVQPIRVEPIHMTVDINIKVDRELEEFFEFENEVIVVPPATQPMPDPAAAPPAAPRN